MSWFMLFIGFWNLGWGIAWSSTDFINLICKVGFVLTGLSALFYAAQLFGYVVQL